MWTEPIPTRVEIDWGKRLLETTNQSVWVFFVVLVRHVSLHLKSTLVAKLSFDTPQRRKRLENVFLNYSSIKEIWDGVPKHKPFVKGRLPIWFICIRAIATKLTHQGDFCAHLNRCFKKKKTAHLAHLAHMQIEFHVILGAKKLWGLFKSPEYFHCFPMLRWNHCPSSFNTAYRLPSGKLPKWYGMHGCFWFGKVSWNGAFHIYLKLLEVLSFRLLVVPLGSPLHR